MPSKNSAISRASGAPPEIGTRSRPPSALAHLREHEPVGDLVAQREPARDGLSGAFEPADLTSDRKRPVDQPPLRARRLVEARLHGRIDLLVHAGDAREHGRADLEHRLADAQRVGQERDREAHVGAGQEHQPPEVVREREIEEHQVVVAVVVLHRVDDARHRVVVAVAEHAALRRPGRPRGVDDGVQVLLVDRRRRLVERGRVRRRVVAAVRGEPGEVVEREHVLQVRQLVRDRLDLRELVGVPQTTPTASECSRRYADVARRAVRVDRDADRADVREREVHERPVEVVLREDPERVALADAACEQAVRVGPDALVRFRPRDFPPAVARLGEVRRPSDARRRPRRAKGARSSVVRSAAGSPPSRRCRLGHFSELTERGSAPEGESRWSQLLRDP